MAQPSSNPFDIEDKATRELWRRWQPDAGSDSQVDARNGKGKASDFKLSDFDPSAKPFSKGDKSDNKTLAQQVAEQLDPLQQVFYADRRFKLLVILQGMDTSGKDGTARGVFGEMSPLGVRSVSWKAPTELERSHDYLWRIHQQVPGAGEIVIFNRSQYEDVLVPVVNQWLTPEQRQDRYHHINQFEKLLSDTGTVILKFMLHISKEEQRQRLQERLDDPAKHWKFDMGDIEVRKQWDLYQSAYEQLLPATHTPWAPWTIVPADSKTHRNLMIATITRAVMENLKLKFPAGDPQLTKFKVE
ncbi:polyphosphate--nucleotide phosphotransferase [Diaphorobacter ruginosibacter]|uniref:Polyphosphate--nucleotide phosphotransferase n=1 Tax=Diaphorobacter ruginosibacter TaxID=1715720 RepID=A0A7G9RNZ8_9BURK|nr:PPK2 family polyphosphate kinase [Diaphorobacter ruginosibacter]QNN57323.1 polyphosphate--nucleotide phosphotransferase [Diaphorobacter ruginosibacter]